MTDVVRRAAVVATALAASAVVAGCGGESIAPPEAHAATTAPVTSVVAPASIPIVVDYSPTLSDVSALLYLASDPTVDLLAVTLAGTGESRCDAAVPNTIALLELVGRVDVPVACGRTDPIGEGHVWPTEWRDAADALPGLELPGPAGRAASIDAADLLADAVASTSGVAVVALGPLTNLAEAVERHPAFAGDVRMVYTMGGAIDVAGNAPNGTAEWNYFVDPTAVDRVLRSGVPLTIVPLDATDAVPVSQAWFTRLGDAPAAPAASAVFDLFRTARPWEIGFYFWDELTAAIAVDESMVTIDEATISIGTDGADAGRTVHSEDGAPVRLATHPDRARFEAELLATLGAG